MKPHYRKTKTGEWVVCGPVDVVKPGATVTVHKRDGSTKDETIASVGKTFEVDGVQCCYGRLQRSSGTRVREGDRPCWESGGYCFSLDGSTECHECGEYIYLRPHEKHPRMTKRRTTA